MEVIEVVFATARGLIRNIYSPLRNSVITKYVAQFLTRTVNMTGFPSPSDNSAASKFSVSTEIIFN